MTYAREEAITPARARELLAEQGREADPPIADGSSYYLATDGRGGEYITEWGRDEPVGVLAPPWAMAEGELPWELAYQDTHGAWVFLGTYATQDIAFAAADEWAAGDVVHHDDFGTVVFGISGDPDSGHYETRYEVYGDGETCIL